MFSSTFRSFGSASALAISGARSAGAMRRSSPEGFARSDPTPRVISRPSRSDRKMRCGSGSFAGVSLTCTTRSSCSASNPTRITPANLSDASATVRWTLTSMSRCSWGWFASSCDQCKSLHRSRPLKSLLAGVVKVRWEVGSLTVVLTSRLAGGPIRFGPG
jgi:hypothetical protein